MIVSANHKTSYLNNSSFTGQTLKGESDFIVDNFVISQERMKVMDYAIVYGSYMARIYIQVPGESIEGLSYTKPFRRNTWIVIGLSFFIVPIITWILMYYRKLNTLNGYTFLNYNVLMISKSTNFIIELDNFQIT